MSITVRNTKKEEFLNVVSVDESTNAAVVDKSYFETSADQVVIDTPIDGVTGSNVAEALKNLATGVSQAGKVDDVQDTTGKSIVENKIAKLSKAAVGLGNVDNTADADKTVKEAGKVTNSLKIGGQNASGTETSVSFDGSAAKEVAFNEDDFNATLTGNTLEVSIVDKGYVTETELTGKGYATKSYTDTELAKKVNKAGDTITGDLAVNGGVTIGGNLTVNGTTTTVNSTTLAVTDKLIEVAHGNTVKLTTPAGLVAPKYDGTNSGALVFDGDGIASVGDVVLDASGNIDVTKSQLQPLATRTGLVDGNLVKYDGTNKTLVDTGKKVENLVTTNTAQEITAAKTFKDEYGTVVINGEITYTPAVSSIGGVNINNEDGDRVIGVFANGGVGQLCLGSSTGKEAALLLKGEPGDAGQVLVSRGIAKTPAWSSTVGSADSATNVTTNINGKAITSIFETNGTTVKNATHATSADSATTAGTASKLAHSLGVSGQKAASSTTTTEQFDGSATKIIAMDTDDFSVDSATAAGTTMINCALRNTGVTAGVYTAVQVDAKGRATAGQQAFAVIGPNDDIPSNVVIGGFVLRTKA